MRKIFGLSIFFILMSLMYLHSQEIERITYIDIGADGSQRINRTVNAVFIGWMQKENKQEGNLKAVYTCICLIDDEWTDWKLESRRPMQMTLNQEYNILIRAYTSIPNAGAVLSIGDGMNVLQLLAKPNGQNSPFWWSKSGNSFYAFYEIYLVIN